jgi:hypothetical protein
MSDRLTLANAIEDAGIERAKAERMASVIIDVIHDNVATKADIASVRGKLGAMKGELKADIASVRGELIATKGELKADIASVRGELAATKGELKADIAGVRTQIADVSARADLIEHRLLTRLGGLMIVVGGVLFAALHYWPPVAHG